MASEKMKRIRIQVGINDLGQWYAQGYSVGGPHSDAWGGDDGEIRQNPDDDYDRGFLFEAMPEGRAEHVVWVEAYVPLPQSQTVEGEVSQ